MARPHVITLRNEVDRAKVIGWLRNAPYGYRVQVDEPKRSNAQNDRFWSVLADISRQGLINGNRYPPEAWKCIFMKALGEESQFLPTLDGASFFPSGFRSSQMAVRAMAGLQTFMEAYAAENGITLKVWGDDE